MGRVRQYGRSCLWDMSFFDHPPSLVRIRPYNGWDCRCGRASKILQGPTVTENRSSHRYPVDINVIVTRGEDKEPHRFMNLSLGGALMTFSERLPLGEEMNLAFRIPTQEEPIMVKCVVRWATPESAGVQFDGLRAREVWSLTEYFKALAE